jgi:hypothetical protein
MERFHAITFTPLGRRAPPGRVTGRPAAPPVARPRQQVGRQPLLVREGGLHNNSKLGVSRLVAALLPGGDRGGAALRDNRMSKK